LDSYEAGKIRVTRNAPAAESAAPSPLPPAEIAKRRSALAARIPLAPPVRLDSDAWRFEIDRRRGAWTLLDKATGALWTSDPMQPRFGEVVLRNGDRSAVWRIDRFDDVEWGQREVCLTAHPQVDGKPTGVTFVLRATAVVDPPGVMISYESRPGPQWRVARVRLLDKALVVTEADEGCVYVPHRLGVERPASTGLPHHLLH
jgi:hypothetical protein